MAMVLINETPTEVGSGADEIIRLRAENAELREELACTIDILEQTRSQLAAAQVDAKRYRWLRDSLERIWQAVRGAAGGASALNAMLCREIVMTRFADDATIAELHRKDGEIIKLRNTIIFARDAMNEMENGVVTPSVLKNASEALSRIKRVIEEGSIDCQLCANLGRVDGLSQETHCEHCVWQEQLRTDHYVHNAGSNGPSGVAAKVRVD